jgi:23S rRNA (cytidine1920-2'-O)/16S rRNA (cytidine1409-2'-O)-methyltransferase
VAKQRLDQALVARGLAESRAKAQALILAGLVYRGEEKLAKAGDLVAEEAALEVRGRDHPWVSRGGLKLDHALGHAGWDIAGAIVMDIGASTGGFTDVALTRGAAKVYSVDVGQGQLAWKLRQDPRVIVLEKTNARHLTTDLVPEAPDLIVCDASFISLKTVLPAALSLAKPGARLAALIKPQFEAGRAHLGKGGVVRDSWVHVGVCADVCAWLSAQPGWRVAGLTESPIQGPEGNREFLMLGELSAG